MRIGLQHRTTATTDSAPTTTTTTKSSPAQTPEAMARQTRWEHFNKTCAELQYNAEDQPTAQMNSFAGARQLLATENTTSVFSPASQRYADRTLPREDIRSANRTWTAIKNALKRKDYAEVVTHLENVRTPEILREMEANCWRDEYTSLRELIKDKLPEKTRRQALLAVDASYGDSRQEHKLGQLAEKFLLLNKAKDVSESELVTRYAPTKNNKLELLVEGQRAFPQILQAIREAKETVNVSYFILANDEIGNKLADELIAAKERGCEVRVALDGIGSGLGFPNSGGREIVATMRAAGVEVNCNHVIDPTNKRERLNHPDHRKLVICDGKVGFTGGMNVADRYVDDYHDLVVRAEGDVVKQMQMDFLMNWLHIVGPIEGDDDELARKFFPQIDTQVGETNTRVVQSIPGETREIFNDYISRINSAEKSIYIGNPYCTNPVIQDALIAAAERGVEIHVLLPGENDQPYSHMAARERYPAMLDAGVKIYEYPGFIHGKALVIDEKYTSIGSENMDDVGAYHIYELNLSVEDAAFAKQCLQRIWEQDLPRSKPMRKEDITTLQKIGGKIFNKLHFAI